MPLITKDRIAIIVVIALAAALSLFFISKINALESQLAVADQNNAALRDTVRIGKTKNGQLEYTRLLFIAENDSLYKYSKKLSDELKKEKGKVLSITNLMAEMKRDTITVENTVVKLPNKEFELLWATRDSSSGGNRILEGNSKFTIIDTTEILPGTTQITKDNFSINIITGIRQRDDKKYEIFARSNYPGVSFNLVGAILDPDDSIFLRQTKRFSIGPVISAGFNQEFKFGFHIGIGIQYSLFRF